MWLTTSKHADTTLKRAASALAAALPGGSFIRRGEQGLERMQELAGREAQNTILVLSAGEEKGKKPASPGFVLRSRRREAGGRKWSWAPREMVVEKMEGADRAAASILNHEPFKVETHGAQSSELAAFLGLADHAQAAYYDEPAPIQVKTDAKGKLQITAGEAGLLTMNYRMRALCQKE